jgi:hypothetical protein
VPCGELERVPAARRPPDQGGRVLLPPVQKLDVAPGGLLRVGVDEGDAGRKTDDDALTYADSLS